MALFTIECTTCRARLKVQDETAIGEILDCPKCGSFVQVSPPPGWQAAVAVAPAVRSSGDEVKRSVQNPTSGEAPAASAASAKAPAAPAIKKPAPPQRPASPKQQTPPKQQSPPKQPAPPASTTKLPAAATSAPGFSTPAKTPANSPIPPSISNSPNPASSGSASKSGGSGLRSPGPPPLPSARGAASKSNASINAKSNAANREASSGASANAKSASPTSDKRRAAVAALAGTGAAVEFNQSAAAATTDAPIASWSTRLRSSLAEDRRLVAGAIVGGITLGLVAWLGFAFLTRSDSRSAENANNPPPTLGADGAQDAAAPTAENVAGVSEPTAAALIDAPDSAIAGAKPDAPQSASVAPPNGDEALANSNTAQPASSTPAIDGPDSAAGLADKDMADPRAESPTPADNTTPSALAEIQARLDYRLREINFSKTSLRAYLEFITECSGLSISLDTAALAKVDKGPRTLVSARLRDATVAEALEAALRPHGLAVVVRNGKLLVTVAE